MDVQGESARGADRAGQDHRSFVAVLRAATFELWRPKGVYVPTSSHRVRTGTRSSAGERFRRDDGHITRFDLPPPFVDVAHVHRAVGASDPAQHARAAGVGEVLVAPLL